MFKKKKVWIKNPFLINTTNALSFFHFAEIGVSSELAVEVGKNPEADGIKSSATLTTIHEKF